MAGRDIKEIARILVLLSIVLGVLFFVLLIIGLISSSILAGLPKTASGLANDVLGFIEGVVLVIVYGILILLNYSLVYLRVRKRHSGDIATVAIVLGIIDIIIGIVGFYGWFIMVPGLLVLLAGILLFL